MKKFLWFKLLSLLADISLGCNLVYQNMVVICNSVQETAIALLVMLLMPLNGCIYASVSVQIWRALLKQNPSSPLLPWPGSQCKGFPEHMNKYTGRCTPRYRESMGPDQRYSGVTRAEVVMVLVLGPSYQPPNATDLLLLGHATC